VCATCAPRATSHVFPRYDFRDNYAFAGLKGGEAPLAEVHSEAGAGSVSFGVDVDCRNAATYVARQHIIHTTKKTG